MVFISTVFVSTLLATSNFVRALTPVARASDSSISGLLAYLNSQGLTALSSALDGAVEADGGSTLADTLNSGDVTLLAPNNDAFSSFDSSGVDITDVLLYHVVYGSIDSGFKTPGSSVSRRLPLENRNTGTSGYKTNGLKATGTKRWTSFDDNQVQIIDQYVVDGRKRWTPTILVNQAVGDAKVLERSTYKKIDVFTIGTVLSIPKTVSDLLCKPLISSTPNGFVKFGGSLQKVGLLDAVDNGRRITVFAPTDDAFDNINLGDYSDNDLAALLKNHYAFGNVVYSPLFPTTSEITAESGNKLQLEVENGVQYVQCGNSKAQVKRSDVISNNGVLHVIDSVLKCD